MIIGLSHVCVYVLDQERAKNYYVNTLGFEVRTDVSMDADAGPAGFRWLTVGPPEQPDIEFILADCGMGVDEATAQSRRELVAKGAMATAVLATDDCQKTYEELTSRGAVFLQGPQERPYGTEALLRDDSGNWFSVTQRR